MNEHSPRNEVEALQTYQILDTPPEPIFHDIVALTACLCSAPAALMVFADRDRFWVKACHGLEVEAIPRTSGLCSRTLAQQGVLVVSNIASDPSSAGDPLLLADPHLRFFAGVPLRNQAGFTIGILCVLDRIERGLAPMQSD